ncbi:MAG TPA: GreA/GreB family elongation factor [Flavobacteriales bacterium]|jgi:transcription elongation factor GreB|nr:GreA/GreB family elongation factor [Flavobacteriales bacterium]
MSRGFVREDDQEEAPFIPPRAPLPPGVENHVTPRGLRLLHAEREALEAQRRAVTGSEDERRKAVAEIAGRMELLNERIATARVRDVAEQGTDEVRFGCTVRFTVRKGPQAGVQRTFTIVGVDEASVAEGRIAFTAPIARALLGAKVGEAVAFALGREVQELVIEAITVEAA